MPNGTATCDGVMCGIQCDPGFSRVGADCLPGGDTCGNGVLEAAETCDDSNRAAGDGCGPDCQVEASPRDRCPGTVLRTAGSFRGDTTMIVPSYTPPCTGFSGSDVVYTFVAPTAGNLQIRAEPVAGYDAVVMGRMSTCAEPFDSCMNMGDAGAPETVVVPVVAGGSYNIVVGSVGSGGAYVLRLSYI